MKKIDFAKPSRRAFIAGCGAVSTFGILTRPASAAEFNYRFASGQAPSFPSNIRAQQAIDRIREATHGKLDIKLFPANQLGADTDLLSQVRSGAIEFFHMSASILATLVPVAGIVNIGFAFPDYPAVWKAVDGPLGAHIRKQIEATGLLTVVPQMWDNGFRQISSSTRQIHTPADLNGYKLRTPVAPIITSLFQNLKASPTPLNFSELYSALQTKIVDGEENPLAIIYTAKIYEVQKSLSMTSHIWDGYWLLNNRRAWKRLPEDIQQIVVREFTTATAEQRADVAALNDSLRGQIAAKGLTVIDVDRNQFRDALRATSFYKDWSNKFGSESWGLLEASVGKLT